MNKLKPHYRGARTHVPMWLGDLVGVMGAPAYDPGHIEFLLHGEVSLFIMNDHEECL